MLHAIRRFRAALAGGTNGDAHYLDRYVASGDEDAFVVLVRRHGPMVLNVCRRVLHNLHDAEDAFQATFLVLSRKAGAIRQRASLASWLYGVAYRTARKSQAADFRRRDREKQAGDVPSPHNQKTNPDAAWHELRAILDEELTCLPEKYRAPLVLCYLEGKTNEEAAEQLGWTKGTVSGRLARARDLLRKRLTRRGLAPSAGMLVGLFGAGTAPAAVPGTLVVATCQAAASFAAGKAALAGPAAALAEGVIRAMFATKCKLILFVVLALGVGAGSAGVLAQRLNADRVPGPVPTEAKQAEAPQLQPAPPPPKVADAAPEEKKPPRNLAADRQRSQTNLKIFGLAMHNYHDTYNKFPAQAIYSKDGKPLLSWRVAILPYIEQDNLHRAFKLDEPWDSEHNKKLLAQMPKEYAPPGIKTAKPHETFYRVFAGPDTAFEGKEGQRIAGFTDGTSNTLLVVEAGKAVPWTKPDELPYDAEKALPKLGGIFDGDFNILMADGSVRLVRRGFNQKTFRAMVTRNGGEVIDPDGLNPK